ncbi:MULTISPECIES: hypothetical protein [unclassified Knoellia]|uniref:hypothetical protein n=1 Tax=Knoellia altitudinis TaxID=3404795 RepID=UPI00361B2B61
MSEQTIPQPRRPIDRRAVLNLGGLTAAGFAAVAATPAYARPRGTGPVGDERRSAAGALAACVTETTMPYQSTINSAALAYEPTSAAASFRFNTTMHSRLKVWQSFWDANTPYPAMDRIDSYGAYVDRGDGCVSLHNYGRAFDIASAWTGGTRHFSARYDTWKAWTGTELTGVRVQYWAAAASLHMHFEHTLTYLYNTAHHNHFHVDNSRSGAGLSVLSKSGTQTYSIQAMLNYVWAKGTGIDGVYGAETTQHSNEVLARIGMGGTLTTSQSHWHAFLTATTRKGTGMQAY